MRAWDRTAETSSGRAAGPPPRPRYPLPFVIPGGLRPGERPGAVRERLAGEDEWTIPTGRSMDEDEALDYVVLERVRLNRGGGRIRFPANRDR